MSDRRSVVLRQHAQLDVVAALVHLDGEQPGLGTVRFAAALRSRLKRLETDALWPVVVPMRGIRWAPMDPPWEKYAVFFTVTDDEVEVRAILHLARNVRRHLRGR